MDFDYTIPVAHRTYQIGPRSADTDQTSGNWPEARPGVVLQLRIHNGSVRVYDATLSQLEIIDLGISIYRKNQEKLVAGISWDKFPDRAEGRLEVTRPVSVQAIPDMELPLTTGHWRVAAHAQWIPEQYRSPDERPRVHRIHFWRDDQ